MFFKIFDSHWPGSILLKTSALQHGFFKESCARAAYTCVETIKLYTKTRPQRYSCALSRRWKAFDVSLVGQFVLLAGTAHSTQICPAIQILRASTFQVTYERKLGGIGSMSCGWSRRNTISSCLLLSNDSTVKARPMNFLNSVGLYIYWGSSVRWWHHSPLSKTSIGAQQMIDFAAMLYCRTWKIHQSWTSGKTETNLFRIQSRNKWLSSWWKCHPICPNTLYLGLEWNGEDNYLCFHL
jgi:hypothetical protein